MKIIKQFIIVLLLFLAAPGISHAAVLFFSPSGGEENTGDVFTVDAKIDLESGDECVNVIEAVIAFDNNYLEAVDFSAGESFLSLWLQLPKLADMPEVNRLGRLSLAGGTPGGYCGKIPGDPGASNIIGKLIFKVKKYQPAIAADSNARIYFLDTAKILLNDGFGTEAKVTRNEAKFNIVAKEVVPKREWDNILTADKTPPEPFIIEIQQNPELYNGQYYLIFSTTDKQTGIDRYEVQEVKQTPLDGKSIWSKLYSAFFKKELIEAGWRTADTPYVLADQSLNSNIKVKAIDKAGNSRIVEYFPKPIASAKSNISIIAAIVLLLILMTAAIIIIVRLIAPKNRINKF